jgi:hypothetical protein
VRLRELIVCELVAEVGDAHRFQTPRVTPQELRYVFVSRGYIELGVRERVVRPARA